MGTWRKLIGANAAGRLPRFMEETRFLAENRLSKLRKIPNVKVMQDIEDGEGVWPFFILLMPSAAIRDAVLNKLWDKGLGVGRLFIHALKDYEYLAPYFLDAHIPNAQAFASQTLIVTNCVWLRERDFAKICDVISEQVSHV